MDKICFLVSSKVLKENIERTLQTFLQNPGFESVPAKVILFHFDTLIAQARAVIRQGVRVIITNSGSYQEISRAIKDVPILCLYSSTNDAIYTLNQVRHFKKIHLLFSKNFLFNTDLFPPDIKEKLELHTYDTGISSEEAGAIADSIPVTPDTVIVGCTLMPVLTHSPLPVYSIMPSESSILSVYQYARDLIFFTRQERKQLFLMTTILSHVDEGIIIYDQKGGISHVNARARHFLKLPDTVKNMADIFPESATNQQEIPQFKEQIIHHAPYTLVANSSSFPLEKNIHYILSLRDVTELQHLEKNVRFKLAKTGLTASHHFQDIQTREPAMTALIDTARTMAAYDAPVLIQGDSGTGKELFAQSIHNAGTRRHGPFVAVNCAALPPELLESELFGYVSGAFTGARKDGKAGLFEMAHNGTIFLDEINSMSAAIQSKLLRVLENKEVMRIGSDYVIPLDIRIISASNSDIIQEIMAGTFRRDLYFRLNTLTLNLPSLDERKKDIVYLFNRFLQKHNGSTTAAPSLPETLKTALEQHHWWGNIRELQSVALRYHMFGEQGDPSYQYLFDQIKNGPIPDGLCPENLNIDLKQLHASVDQLVIDDLLSQGYTKTQVARIFHISRQTLFNKLHVNIKKAPEAGA